MAYDSNGNWVLDGTNTNSIMFQPQVASPLKGNVLSGDFASIGNYGTPIPLDTSSIPLTNQNIGWMDNFKNWFNDSGFLKQTNADGSSSGGWGTAGLGTLQGLGSLYLGMQQYGLAKDQLAFSKSAFEKNYAAQRQMTNASLEDRQASRVASNPNAYQSVGSYMNKYGVK